MANSPVHVTATGPAVLPAAGGRAAAPLDHRSWCDAHGRLLAALADGPAFLALLGPAGTGKTWLLRAVSAALRQQGRRTLLLSPEDFDLSGFDAGSVVLVDGAAALDEGRLAQLAGLRGSAIVLADRPNLLDRLAFLPRHLVRPVTVVPLVPLTPHEVPGFVAGWLASRGIPAEVVDDGAVARLAIHALGVPRLLVQILRAALAMADHRGAARVGAELVDEVAALRLGGPALPDPPPLPGTDRADHGIPTAGPGRSGSALPPPLPAPGVPRMPASGPATPVVEALFAAAVPPRRRLVRPGAVAASGLAAAVLLGVSLPVLRDHPLPPATVETGRPTPPGQADGLPTAAVPDAAPGATPGAAGAQSALAPPVGPAHAPPADLVGGAGPEPEGPRIAGPTSTEPPPALPDQVPGPEPVDQIPQAPAPHDLAAQPEPHVEEASAPPMPEPEQSALLPDAPPVLEAPGPARRGGPGLVLVAQAGDTMPALYAKMYRGMTPPPYSEFVAANQAPFRPGAIVVFPAPTQGWPHP